MPTLAKARLGIDFGTSNTVAVPPARLRQQGLDGTAVGGVDAEPNSSWVVIYTISR